MNIGLIATLSCVFTSITMVIFSGLLFVIVQSGGKGVQAVFNRFFGGGQDKDKQVAKASTESVSRDTAQISSGEALRQRAKQLEFAPQAAATGFSAQAAGYDPLAAPQQANFPSQYSQAQSGYDPLAAPPQASFTPRDTLNAPQQASFSAHDPLAAPPQQNPQFGRQQAPLGQANPTMPSLSSGRTIQPGQQPLGAQPNQYGQQPYQPLGGQNQYQAPQQPLGGNQYGQAQQPPGGQRPPLPPIGGQNQYGQAQQPAGGQRPPLPPIGGQNQRGQQAPQPPSGLGNYAPPLGGQVNFNQNTSPNSLRRKRDSRKGDDRDILYDEDGGIGGIIGDLGDFLG